jgi:HlyD family secretion protein
LRPGLSATAKITTANKANALTIPIQALVERNVAAEKALADNAGKPAKVKVSASTTAAPADTKLVQGVYLLKEERKKIRVVFVPVKTGITGATDIEVLSGLKAGDEIVTGRYKVLRILKSGTVVKRDNTPETVTPTDQ